MIWTNKQLENALSINLISKVNYNKVEFNSLDIQENDLFIALPGNRDGHEFVQDALNRGAGAAIVSRNIPSIDPAKLIIVQDTLSALNMMADYKRRTSKAKIIAITGSVGKTSTKEAVKIMLESYGKVHATRGTFNNLLGVPLTIASMPDDTDYAVIEMGMNAKGELAALSNDVIPDIAVITTISEGHLKFFSSIEEIAAAKCEIISGLDINTGIVILNSDISLYNFCLEKIDAARLQNVQTFGKHNDSHVKFLSYEILENEKTRMVYAIGENEIEIVIDHILPEHLAANFAAAFAVVHALGLNLDGAIKAISSYQALLGRGRIINVSKGKKTYQIICDYYNSNPQSLKASLQYFTDLTSEGEGMHKIAVLGDMGELGSSEVMLHKKMVPYIKNSGASKVFLVGDIMKQIENDIPKDILVKSYSNVDELINEFESYVQGGELILIKGSRAMQLEKLAKYLGVKDVL